MFRIHRIFDDGTELNRQAIVQVQLILKMQFPLISDQEIEKIRESLQNPLKFRFRPILYVSETAKSVVNACALMLYATDLNFCYLDYISVLPAKFSRGLGGVLYERLRHEARFLKVPGIFFECLSDDPALSRDLEIRKQNKARLKFYERYGAFPVINTRYETPLKPDEDNPPYLVLDPLDTGILPSRQEAQKIVRAILERKYGDLCSPEYVETVVSSFLDDPIRLRAPKYLKKHNPQTGITDIPLSKKIRLIVNDQHEIHHVHERGYVESPVRIKSILKHLEPTGLFEKLPRKEFPEKHIREVHEKKYIEYFKKVCKHITPNRPVYPYVFPIRNKTRPPKVLSVRAGYFCVDTFTPLSREAYQAAKGAVDAALTGAECILEGDLAAYALVRPPGHHAERGSFGGFCYFNSNAIAAHYLSKHGKVAILDLDYHHGNGQQDIFYHRNDVYTVSIHGHPNFAYPYFSGFADETGEGVGSGYNLNIPLPEQISEEQYRIWLIKALNSIRRFNPDFLVVAFGVDTAKNDPTGSWSLNTADFHRNGELVGELKIRTLIVQEGGYDNRVIGTNVRNFFTGFWNGFFNVSV
ncbi:MAG: histone deacetylase family protein [Bacteroidales bacterium]|nr:histone deacetylase family protein [Bacteroidales bacterium]